MARKSPEEIQSRKAQLIADLAVARSGLRRDIVEVRQFASVSGQLRSAFKGKSGKTVAAAGALSLAAGAAASKFFKRGSGGSVERKAGSFAGILNDAFAVVVDLLLKKGAERYFKEEWQKTAARAVVSFLSNKVKRS